jgi:hypothetical protein
MGQISSKLRSVEGGGHAHWCEGCGQFHVIPGSWKFDGNLAEPTFSPSVLTHGVKVIYGPDGRWTGEWQRDEEGKPMPYVCHYFLTAGMLCYCADSQHHLAGQQVPLPDLPFEYRD